MLGEFKNSLTVRKIGNLNVSQLTMELSQLLMIRLTLMFIIISSINALRCEWKKSDFLSIADDNKNI